MSDALTIYQDHLDEVSEAVWTLDFAALSRLLILPNRIRTSDAEIVLETDAELRRLVRAYREFLGDAGAQDYHRVARDADYAVGAKGRIEGTHDTYVLRGGQYVLQPFISSQVLIHRNGIWRGAENHAQVRNCDVAVLSPEFLKEVRIIQSSRADVF